MDACERSRYDALASELTGLSTCDALVDWGRRVKEAVDGLRLAIENANAQMVPVFQEKEDRLKSLELAKLEFSQRPFLKRMAGDHSNEKSIEARIAVLDQWLSSARSEIAQFEALSNQLAKLAEFASEFGPKTLAEKRRILASLRQQKKEFQLQKRELAATITALRKEARAASAAAGKRGLLGQTGSFGDGKFSDDLAWYDPSLAADQRRSIRAVKEEFLHPLESQKANIEQRMLALDKHIAFVEQFQS